jgi:hypothetical protein
MMARGKTIRAGPWRWGRLHPLPRGDTALPSEGCEEKREALRKVLGTGPPVRFGRARESIAGEAPVGEVYGIGPPEVVGRTACSTTGTGAPEVVGRTASPTTGTGPPGDAG